MTEVSIIIPVYNAEKAIGRCIDSILTQEFTDFELILINDGSKDGSAAILDEYAAKDPRIQVIHKENSGVSATRNLGLEKAKGKYIQFLDADDWMTSDSTKLLYRAMKEDECDLVVAGFYRVVGDRVARKSSIDADKLLSLREYSEYMMENPADYYYGVLWNKLYRADIIREHQIRMDEKLSFCEDFVFNLDYLLHVNKIRTLNVPVYYYVKTEGGLVSKNLNPVRLIQMKLSVFTYYSRFFKDVLNEEQYKAERANIAGFLIAAASDDMVVPMMPGTRKLGEETVQVSYEHGEESPLMMSYYQRKLFERYISTVGIKYDLSLRDMWIICAIHFARHIHFTNEISDFIGFNQFTVLASIEKLEMKNVITQTYLPDRQLPVFKVVREDLLKDLDQACEDLLSVLTKGMSDEEKSQFDQLIRKADRNIREMLKVE
ncbi:MAG: glycosyltransferase family 2 protein [Erysipelotrichaceae bacterium]|nr:glycosyltransferase family 2 protein [Erysipelotrichaceae bacterium]